MITYIFIHQWDGYTGCSGRCLSMLWYSRCRYKAYAIIVVTLYVFGLYSNRNHPVTIKLIFRILFNFVIYPFRIKCNVGVYAWISGCLTATHTPGRDPGKKEISIFATNKWSPRVTLKQIRHTVLMLWEESKTFNRLNLAFVYQLFTFILNKMMITIVILSKN